MATCKVRWRPSGGRGEYEVVPSSALAGRRIHLNVPAFEVQIDARVEGTKSQGKPRLRKLHPNDRSEMHLVPLVMAVARLPDPAREDVHGTDPWPLESKKFIVSEMEFDILSDSGSECIIRPEYARILHSNLSIDLKERMRHVREDGKNIDKINSENPQLAAIILSHDKLLLEGKNTSKIRLAADAVLELQSNAFGASNSASVTTIQSLPATPLEDDLTGKEGRVLTRLHSFRERDRSLVAKAKQAFRTNHGSLFCECCGLKPEAFYGPRGEGRIQAHHRTPLEQLLPDSTTSVTDLAMVCANCHDIIHAQRPWLSVEELRHILRA